MARGTRYTAFDTFLDRVLSARKSIQWNKKKSKNNVWQLSSTFGLTT
uniref:Uncharacterized protein n=1 Tax=Anguilla anguilla TaxID=7936 RepID=A0A0E9RNY8_ANGAN